MFGDEIRDIILRSVYGLAKGQSGVAIKVSSVALALGWKRMRSATRGNPDA